MQRFFVVLVLLFSWGFPPHVQAAETASSPAASKEASRGGLKNVLEAFHGWQELKSKLTAKQVSLKFEEKLTFPSLTEIEKINKELEKLNEKLATLQTQYALEKADAPSNEGEIKEEDVIEAMLLSTQKEIDNLKSKRLGFENTYQTRKGSQQTNIQTLVEEIEDVKEALEKQEKLIWTQLSNVVTNLVLIGIMLVGLLALRWGTNYLIRRLPGEITEERTNALIKLNKIGFNILIALLIIAVLFAQFVNFLPFLAILGTGIAFAVRDSISSFIAWFIIGSQRGYRVGDIIQVGGAVGRVRDIGPFLTMLQDMSDGEKTGKVTTFANKAIFEHELRNFSRCYRFILEHVSFLITQNSDIDKAKKLLLKTINEHNAEHQERIDEYAPKLQKYCELTKDDCQPLVWIEPDVRGVVLRGRFLTHVDRREEMLASIAESFFKIVQKEEKIWFRFVESEAKAKSAQAKGDDHDHPH